jgi:hypothetical protein
VRQPSLEDFIAEPGSTTEFKPFMLHADLWLGLDRATSSTAWCSCSTTARAPARC